MAVRSSAPVSLVTDIVGEFGGSAPYSLTAYYRGGDLVPNTTVNQDAGVPTSGAISLTNFLGTSASGGATSETLTLTSGVDSTGVFRGFSLFANASDLVPDTLPFTSFNVTIINLYYNTSAGTLVFEVNTNSGNSGWTSMQLGSNTFTKDSATYALRAGTASQWTWDSSEGVDNNTMPSSGTISVIFTQ